MMLFVIQSFDEGRNNFGGPDLTKRQGNLLTYIGAVHYGRDRKVPSMGQLFYRQNHRRDIPVPHRTVSSMHNDIMELVLEVEQNGRNLLTLRYKKSLVLVINPIQKERKVGGYDLSDLAGKLEWRSDAVAVQKNSRDGKLT